MGVSTITTDFGVGSPCLPDSGESYSAYSVSNFRSVPQVKRYLTERQCRDIEIVARVLPFKTNSHVVDHLIHWEAVPRDPMFLLNFPQRDMLLPHHFDEIESLVSRGAAEAEIELAAHRIRMELNPHPAGQIEHNVPSLNGVRLPGMQHKYREAVLFFPANGQTCHAYCTFCFRWPQIVGMEGLKFAMKETELLVAYLREHPEITDVLFTGGDPMIMRAKYLRSYIEPLLAADLTGFHTIRIGTKSLSYWPARYLTDTDADEVLDIFRRITASGIHLSVMAHFNHPRELQGAAVEEAIARIRATGAEIRTQSPLLKHVNDDPRVWSAMWRRQVDLGLVPYYMFVARDTGAQHYFGVPLVRAAEIFHEAYRKVSGICRTVRGPSMSADPGKVEVLGTTTVAGEEVIALRMLQGRDPDWTMRPFFARYDPDAIWLSDLRPAFGDEKFFWEDGLAEIYSRTREVPASG